MNERLERKGGWPNPNLNDANQSVARSFGAERTPDVFVFDRDLRLCYRGAPDEDYDDPSREAAWLREALDAVLADGAQSRPRTEPAGCTIKWIAGFVDPFQGSRCLPRSSRTARSSQRRGFDGGRG
jgi:hypothetical protein